jgi:hypothetical protein
MTVIVYSLLIELLSSSPVKNYTSTTYCSRILALLEYNTAQPYIQPAEAGSNSSSPKR